MHRNHATCAEFEKGTNCFLRIHVHFATARWVICADRQEGDVDGVPFADFAKAIEIGRVTAMENGTAADLDDEPAEAAVRIVENTRAPMVARGQSNLDPRLLVTFPIVQLVDAAESEVMDKISDLKRDDDWLIGRHFAQRFPIEMIKMRVRYQHQIDGGKIV